MTMTRTRNTVLILVVASLALILWDLRASDTAIRSVGQQVAAPLQRTATAMFAPLGNWAHDVQAFGDPGARALAARPVMAAIPPGWSSATGRVVAADIAGDRATVTIDVGAEQGVQVGNAVLAVGGLVGSVSQVAGGSATVLLVTDPESMVGVRVRPSGEMGVVTGSGMDRDLVLDILNPAAEVAPGDEVETLGSVQRAGIPADLPLGRIAQVDASPVESGRSATVAPVAGMTTLETLVVLTGRR